MPVIDWIKLVGALALVGLIGGLWLHDRHLANELTKARTTEQVALAENKLQHNQIVQLQKDKEFDEGLLQDMAQKKEVIRVEADKRKAEVAKQPDGAAPPAVVCAITGVCN